MRKAGASFVVDWGDGVIYILNKKYVKTKKKFHSPSEPKISDALCCDPLVFL